MTSCRVEILGELHLLVEVYNHYLRTRAPQISIPPARATRSAMATEKYIPHKAAAAAAAADYLQRTNDLVVHLTGLYS